MSLGRSSPANPSQADVNGADAQPLWKYLKEHAETPVQDIDWVSEPRGGQRPLGFLGTRRVSISNDTYDAVMAFAGLSGDVRDVRDSRSGDALR